MGQGACDKKLRYGVFLSNMSYSRGFIAPERLLISTAAKDYADQTRRAIYLLLLTHHVVHLPLANAVYLSDPYFADALQHLLAHPDIRLLIEDGYISTTFGQAERHARLNNYFDEHRKIGWNYTADLGIGALTLMKSAPAGFNFDNGAAGEMAATFLDARLRECEKVFGHSASTMLHNIDLTRSENSGLFLTEDFVARTLREELKDNERKYLSNIIHHAYFINPNHLADHALDRERYVFHSYETTSVVTDTVLPTKAAERLLMRPSFILHLMSSWLSDEEVHAFLHNAPACLKRMRADYRWEAFVHFFHAELVPQLVKRLLIERELDPIRVRDFETMVGDTAGSATPSIAYASDGLSEISKAVKFGSVVPLILRNRWIRNKIDNWNRPQLRAFVDLLHDNVRRLDEWKNFRIQGYFG